MRTQLLTAAFFMEGLHEAKPGGYDVIIPAWGKGCIEMVDALIGYVPFTTKLCDAAALASGGCFPGVFDYEISGPFGRWYGEYILEHGGDEPPEEEAKQWLAKAVTSFFFQDLPESEGMALRKLLYIIASK